MQVRRCALNPLRFHSGTSSFVNPCETMTAHMPMVTGVNEMKDYARALLKTLSLQLLARGLWWLIRNLV
jgi:hypothetical protein